MTDIPKHLRCEMEGCADERYLHPQRGPLCVCETHMQLVEAGVMRVPPIRKMRDYVVPRNRVAIIIDPYPVEETQFTRDIDVKEPNK